MMILLPARRRAPKLPFATFAVLTLALCAGLPAVSAQTISYVQGNYATPQSPQTTVTVAFTGAQAIGDLNVVVVGWSNTTSAVNTVTDNKGNTYTRAIGPTAVSGTASQSIYYAKNIAAAVAGANTVTVTFSTAAAFPDIRILEYKGADPNSPLDVTVGKTGSSTSSSSGAVTTTNAADLLLAANYVSSGTTGAGSGFTSRMITQPDTDIVEDRMVAAAGSYTATAPDSPSGWWIMQLVTFRAASGGGPTPPTAPGNLTSASVSTSQINLAWTASTSTIGLANYVVQRCQGPACTSFAQVASLAATATTYSDTGLTASASYSYRVQAIDTAGNQSAFSNTATAITQGPPTAPANLTATAAGTTQINLSWTASTSSVGLANYLVQRCQSAGCGSFAQVALLAATATTYNNTGLAANTSYSYQVQAVDTAGNLSVFSNVASAITPAPTATIQYVQSSSATPQTPQAAVTVTYSGAQTAGDLNVVAVGWGDSTAVVNTVTDKSGNTYSRAVGPTIINGTASQSIYYARNIIAAAAGNIVTVTFSTGAAYPDVRILEYSGADPSNPLDVTAAQTGSSTSTSSGSVTTTNAADLLLGANYVATGTTGAGAGFISRMITQPDSDIVEDQMVAALGSYSATAPVSPLGWWVMQMVAFRAASVGGGTTPPTAPGNLTSTAVSTSQINLNWAASTSSVGLANYIVQRCQGVGCASFAQVALLAATATTYSDTGLTSSASYSYRVQAVDTAGNQSQFSNVSSAVTQGPPTAPGNLTATASSVSQIKLSWTGSTSSVGLANYIVQRCQAVGCSSFAQVALLAATATTYNDTGLATGTSYSYRVQAVDTAGNQSAFSNVSSATTQAPPTAPGNATATAASASQINLSWSASTGGVGLVSYAVQRCQGTSCTSFAQVAAPVGTSYSDTGLIAGTSYSYRVQASDTAGNQSPFSNVATALTSTVPTAPGNLTAFGIRGAIQIDLIWTASTSSVGVANYIVDRCQGTGCSNFVQIATATGTTYNDSALAANTTYNYQVQAVDTGGNSSPFSNVANATTQGPTPPGNLTITGASISEVSMNWIASTDTVLTVSAYLVQRCQGAGCTAFAQVGTSITTTYTDTGLTANTVYNYRVQATDAAGNLSAYSNVASATTLAPAGTIRYVQSNYLTPQTSQTTVAVTFTGAQTAGDLNVVAVGWSDSTTLVNAVTDRSGNTYTRAVGPTAINGIASQSIYYARNIAAAAAGVNIVTVTFSKGAAFPDVRILEYSGADPNNPLDVTAAQTGNNTSASSGSVTTTNAVDLLLGANYVATATTGAGNGFTSRMITQPDADIVEDQLVTAPGSYSATAPVTPVGWWVMQMVAFRAASGGGPPAAPGNLTATAATTSQINLSWTASASGLGVANYIVQRCQGAGCSNFVQVAAPIGTTYIDTGLTAAISYSYQVQAMDTAGNVSPFSNAASAIPQADTLPPTAPTSLTATPVGGNQISLSWTPSIDNVGVSSYLLQRCQGTGCANFAQVAAPATATYTDSTLSPGISYTYQASATDAAGNFSPLSNTATATTFANISGLVAAYSFDEGYGTTVGDSSGNGNTGTITNAVWSTGKYGNGLLFGGMAIVTVPDSASLHLTTGMTLEAWLNPQNDPLVWADVLEKGDDDYLLEASSPTSGPGGGGTFGTADVRLSWKTQLPLNTWSHVAVSYDGATLRLYLNGTQVSSQAQTGLIATSIDPLQIGGDGFFGQFYLGSIDELRVYNVALTQAQIQADMNTSVGSVGLVPILNVSTTALAFGNQPVGMASAAQVITLTNTEGPTLNITSMAISGLNSGDFGQTNNCGASLALHASCNINVTFSPTSTGSRGASFTVTDNASNSPQTIDLTGTATGFSISPKAVDLTYMHAQQFTATAPTVTWSVDGVTGGASATGTITTAGLYTPPSTSGTHTVTATATAPPQSASATVYVTNYPGTFTYHNDNLRTGQNISETVLTTANVNPTEFGQIFADSLDGIALASPLYVANVNIPGQGYHNVVYVATEHDSVFAFDADAGSSTPLWKTSFINPAAGVTPVPAADTGESSDIPVQIGITGTPVIDPATNTLYVVAATKEVTGGNTNYVHRLHALDITTGAEKFGGPTVIQASVPGTGAGVSGSNVAFNNLYQNQRPGLLLTNGVIYIGFGSHGDNGPWHGWVLGYNATTLRQTMVYNVTPNSIGGGVWQSGGGLSTDSTGSIYFSTGNGGFDVNTGGTDYGDSVERLSPSGAVLDYFTPYDQASLSANDLDLASAGPVLLVDQSGTYPHLLVCAGKGGTIYVLNRDNLGRYNPAGDTQVVQSLISILPNGTEENGNYSAPVYFNGYIYFAAVNDELKAFQLTNGQLSPGPVSQSAEIYPNRGGVFAISANGASNGILWAVQNNMPNIGVLRAYDATNLGNELYNSAAAAGFRDSLGVTSKFTVPLVANGKVYVATQTQLVAYSLLP